jgi:hypothetical protein
MVFLLVASFGGGLAAEVIGPAAEIDLVASRDNSGNPQMIYA